MTAHEIYEHGVRELPAGEKLRLAKLILDELNGSPDGAWAEEVRGLTLPNDMLLRLAQTHQPPQSWRDEQDDPFSPEESK